LRRYQPQLEAAQATRGGERRSRQLEQRGPLHELVAVDLGAALRERGRGEACVVLRATRLPLSAATSAHGERACAVACCQASYRVAATVYSQRRATVCRFTLTNITLGGRG